MADTEDAVRRRNAVAEYRKKLLQHKELESRVRSGLSLFFFHRFSLTSGKFFPAFNFRLFFKFTVLGFVLFGFFSHLFDWHRKTLSIS
jgi:hypothetical protein